MANLASQSVSIFAVSDAWFVISEYMTYHDITSLSTASKEANTWMNQPPVWEQQCNRFFDIPTDNDTDSNNSIQSNRFKLYFKHLIRLYGKESIKYYKRVLHCWHSFRDWCASNLPQMLNTFNPPATAFQLNGLKRMLCNKEMMTHNNYGHLTPYLILLGQCCDGQTRTLPRMGMYGYYTFYNKASSGHLLSIADAIKYTKQAQQIYASNKQLSELWLFCAGIPSMDRLITIPCLTFMNLSHGKICKITQDAHIIELEHCGSGSFIQHFEFYVFGNLLVNNYRVNPEQGILRYPLKDKATSECITKGILCRGSPLFVPEISNVKHENYIFAYHIEIDCPSRFDESKDVQKRCEECPKKQYQLSIRKWFIEDDGQVERVEGPGVIGLFPKVCVDQELFQYESCSQQSQPSNGRMWGRFVFVRGDVKSKDTFELHVDPYKLDWNLCQWI